MVTTIVNAIIAYARRIVAATPAQQPAAHPLEDHVLVRAARWFALFASHHRDPYIHRGPADMKGISSIEHHVGASDSDRGIFDDCELNLRADWLSDGASHHDKTYLSFHVSVAANSAMVFEFYVRLFTYGRMIYRTELKCGVELPVIEEFVAQVGIDRCTYDRSKDCGDAQEPERPFSYEHAESLAGWITTHSRLSKRRQPTAV
jgi:hypothetical protein